MEDAWRGTLGGSSLPPGGAAPGEGLVLRVGGRYPVGERQYTLTARLARVAARARLALVDAARHREVMTYGELSDAVLGEVLPRHMGPLLHMLGHDCAARGEPALPALVVSAATGEVGTHDASWAPGQREACWDYWACPSAQ